MLKWKMFNLKLYNNNNEFKINFTIAKTFINMYKKNLTKNVLLTFEDLWCQIQQNAYSRQ